MAIDSNEPAYIKNKNVIGVVIGDSKIETFDEYLGWREFENEGFKYIPVESVIKCDLYICTVSGFRASYPKNIAFLKKPDNFEINIKER